MKEPSTFPGAVWNGLSDNPTRSSLNDDIPPESRDWDRIVAEVIATQTELTSLNAVAGFAVAALSADIAKKMQWQGTYNASTAYVVGDVVYNSADFIWYVNIADDTGNTPGDPGSVLIWEALTAPITGLPAITGIMMPADGYHVLTVEDSGESVSWSGLDHALAIADLSQRTAYTLDPTSNDVYHGTPLTLYRQTGVAATGEIETGNGLTDNLVLTAAVVGEDWNGYTFTVEETENATIPIVVDYDSGNKIYTATIDDTANTLVSDVVTAWNAAQSDFVVTYNAEDEYDPSAMAPVQLTVESANGVDEVAYVTKATTNSAFDATIIGLAYTLSEDAAVGGEEILAQYQGTMNFTANQCANTFNNSSLDSDGLLVPGTPYYLEDTLLEDLPGVPGSYLTPVCQAITTTSIRLHIGLPIAVSA